MVEPAAASLHLSFTLTPYGEKARQVEQRIELAWTQPHYGGRRWWFVCPSTGRRAGKLHLPPGGAWFASRTAWRLAYRSQRSAAADRPFDKLFRLQDKLGGPMGWDAGLRRPKGMHHRTYERHLARYWRLDAQCSAAGMAMLDRLKRGGLDL
jgi:hypothetical protein